MNREKDSKFDLLAVLLLLCVFSVLMLSVLLSGAGGYGRLTSSGRDQQDIQTASLYISNKIFQAETTDDVYYTLGDGGMRILCIDSRAGGEDYVTRIYCHDGWIREYFSAADVQFDPDAGEKVMKAQSLSFLYESIGGTGPVLWVDLATEDASIRLPFSMPTGGYRYAK